MQTLQNVHQQFAEFFKSEILKPFAFLVSRKLSEGHICIQVSDVHKELETSPYFDRNIGVDAIARLKKDPLVTTNDGIKQPFVLHNNRLYLQRYFNYETSILKSIQSFITSKADEGLSDVAKLKAHEDLIKALFINDEVAKTGNRPEDINWQLVAAVAGVLNRFTIITGGPGTGKTTTVAKILALLFSIHSNLKVALAAPTGKAAVRMAESLKAASATLPEKMRQNFNAILPGTIHRLLKPVAETPYFKHNRLNPLNFDVVIIDESSMIDVALFAKLLDAVGPQTNLILLGDKDQLASVEAGSLFGDLCKTPQATDFIANEERVFINSLIDNRSQHIPESYSSEREFHPLMGHIVELKKSRRFTSGHGIGRFSKAIISNDVPTLNEYLNDNFDEQVTIDQEYNQQLFEEFIEGYKNYIHEPDILQAIQKLNTIRVLCAVREGEQGLYKINEAIENLLKKKKWIEKTGTFYNNRPIIITKNYYSLGLFNGDVGIIRPDENGVLKAWFETGNEELKSVLPGYIAEAETVFAMTIHKSQGSEYKDVLVVLPNATNIPILTRELLYTAVTRARKKVILQATKEVILHTAAAMVKRVSGIMERFKE